MFLRKLEERVAKLEENAKQKSELDSGTQTVLMLLLFSQVLPLFSIKDGTVPESIENRFNLLDQRILALESKSCSKNCQK